MNDSISLALYHTYSRDDVIGCFRCNPIIDDGVVRIFTTTQTDLICFAEMGPACPDVTYGSRTKLPYFGNPQLFYWFPSDELLEGVTTNQQCIAPAQVFTEHSGIHLLATSATLTGWIYVGTLRLIGVTGEKRGKLDVATGFTFRVTPKLSHEIWTSFGGFEWCILHIGTSRYILNQGEDCQLILRHNWGRLAPELEVGSYDRGSLFGVTDDLGRAVVCYRTDEAEFHSVNSEYKGDPAAWIAFPTSSGYDFEAPASQAISKDAAIQIVESFLRTGKPLGLLEKGKAKTTQTVTESNQGENKGGENKGEATR
jgi:hypothetical protein